METLRALITILLKNKRMLFQMESQTENSNSIRNYNRKKKEEETYLYT